MSGTTPVDMKSIRAYLLHVLGQVRIAACSYRHARAETDCDGLRLAELAVSSFGSWSTGWLWALTRARPDPSKRECIVAMPSVLGGLKRISTGGGTIKLSSSFTPRPSSSNLRMFSLDIMD